jgi:hypothetical protein
LEYLAGLPNPIQLVPRKKLKKLEKQLKFPISPAFVNNYNLAKDEQVNPVIDYCRQKNIPYEEREERFYKINQAK